MTITIKGLWQYDGLVKDHEAALREAMETEGELRGTVSLQKDTITEQTKRILRMESEIRDLKLEAEKQCREIERLEKKVREGRSYYDYTTGMWHTPGRIFNIEMNKLEDCPPEGVPGRRVL